jgi:hypothetical protein
MEDFNFASGWQKNPKEKVANLPKRNSEQKFSVASVILQFLPFCDDVII